jgi:hypothetical protein
MTPQQKGTTQPSPVVANPASGTQGSPAEETMDFGRYLLELTALLTAVIFLTGWEYGHAYFSVFGVGLTQLDVTVPYFFVLAYRPLVAGYSVLLVVAGLLFVLPRYPDLRRWFKRRWPSNPIVQQLPSISTRTLMLLGVISLFLLLRPLVEPIGEQDAMRDLFAETTMLPAVSVTLKESEQALGVRLKKAGILEGQYYLLGHHKTSYYLVPPRRRSSISITPPLVIILPDERVAAVRILALESRHE